MLQTASSSTTPPAPTPPINFRRESSSSPPRETVRASRRAARVRTARAPGGHRGATPAGRPSDISIQHCVGYTVYANWTTDRSSQKERVIGGTTPADLRWAYYHRLPVPPTNSTIIYRRLTVSLRAVDWPNMGRMSRWITFDKGGALGPAFKTSTVRYVVCAMGRNGRAVKGRERTLEITTSWRTSEDCLFSAGHVV